MEGIEDGDAEIRSELAALAARVGALEQALQRGAPLQSVQSPPPEAIRDLRAADAPAASSTPTQILPQTPTRPQPAAPAITPQPLKPQQSLESRIGSFLLNRIGVIAVMIGMAWFLKLAFDYNWINPSVRILLGLAIAVGLVLWSERFRRRNFAAFSYSLKALGTGIAYLSLWAAYSVYSLVSAGIAFALMVVITIANAALAWQQDSELLAAYALAGGLATPALLSTGQNHELFLFSYLLLLDLGALVLCSLRPWNRLVLGAFLGTAVYFGLWWVNYYSPDAFALTGLFLLLFFLVFTAAPLLALYSRDREQPGQPAISPAHPPPHPLVRAFLMIGFPIVVHAAAFIAAWFWASGDRAFLRSWIALGLAVSSAGVDLLARSRDGITVNRTHSQTGESVALRDRAPHSLAATHFGLAIFFVALAAWIEFDRHVLSLCWLTVCWLVESLVLAAMATIGHPHHHHAATPVDHITLPRIYATLMLGAATVNLLLLEWIDPPAYFTRPILNSHFLTSLAGLAVSAATAWMCRRAVATHPPSAQHANTRPALRKFKIDPGSILFLGGYAVVAFNIVALAAGAVQIHLYWMRDHLQQSALRLATAGPHTVGFSYSLWFMVYGAILMTVGFLRRSGFLRWQALLLLAFAIAKVFLIDASRLSQGYRVMSFLGLGALLLAISFAYQKDWLALRDRDS